MRTAGLTAVLLLFAAVWVDSTNGARFLGRFKNPLVDAAGKPLSLQGKSCGTKCKVYEDCTSADCPFCAAGECVSSAGVCGKSCQGTDDCGGDCTVCSRSGYCMPSGNNGTCLVECGTNNDCRGDCGVCSGDNRCHGPSNVCNAECGTDNDCVEPCPVS